MGGKTPEAQSDDDSNESEPEDAGFKEIDPERRNLTPQQHHHMLEKGFEDRIHGKSFAEILELMEFVFVEDLFGREEDKPYPHLITIKKDRLGTCVCGHWIRYVAWFFDPAKPNVFYPVGSTCVIRFPNTPHCAALKKAAADAEKKLRKAAADAEKELKNNLAQISEHECFLCEKNEGHVALTKNWKKDYVFDKGIKFGDYSHHRCFKIFEEETRLRDKEDSRLEEQEVLKLKEQEREILRLKEQEVLKLEEQEILGLEQEQEQEQEILRLKEQEQEILRLKEQEQEILRLKEQEQEILRLKEQEVLKLEEEQNDQKRRLKRLREKEEEEERRMKWKRLEKLDDEEIEKRRKLEEENRTSGKSQGDEKLRTTEDSEEEEEMRIIEEKIHLQNEKEAEMMRILKAASEAEQKAKTLRGYSFSPLFLENAKIFGDLTDKQKDSIKKEIDQVFLFFQTKVDQPYLFALMDRIKDFCSLLGHSLSKEYIEAEDIYERGFILSEAQKNAIRNEYKTMQERCQRIMAGSRV